MRTPLPGQDAWTRAKDRYVEDLSDEERSLYTGASAETLFYGASSAQKSHGTDSNSRKLMAKLQPFVGAIKQYGQAMDVYSNAYPLGLSPLWGSVRVVLQIAREFGKYFEKLVEMFTRIGDVLPQFQTYQKLFSDHERLIQALSLAYVDIISFCAKCKKVFRKGQRSSVTSLKIGFKLIWKPLEVQFGEQLDSFREHRKNVEREAGLSHMIEAADARAVAVANHAQMEQYKREDLHRKIVAAIPSVDHETNHYKQRRLRFENTCSWLLGNKAYLEWKEVANSSYICLHGIPGCGKSVLLSTIIDDLIDCRAGTQLVYYYCDYTDQRTLRTDNILGTVLKQFLPAGHIPDAIEVQVRKVFRDGTRLPEFNELIDLVCSAVNVNTKTFLVLDGIDECEKEAKQQILVLLKRLAISIKTGASIKIVVSCREEDHILRSLPGYSRIHITAKSLEVDINAFVTGSVRSRIDTGELQIRNPDLEQQIISELANKAHGMFLWVYFQMDELCEASTDAKIRETLLDLPYGLVETYERILSRIKTNTAKASVVLKVFQWITTAQRPLFVDELIEAVAFDPWDKSWDGDKIPNEDFMIEACRGLVVRGKTDKTVRFAHHTIQQFVLSVRNIGDELPLSFNIDHARAFVGQMCVTYLSFSDFETQVVPLKSTAVTEPAGGLPSGSLSYMPNVLGIGSVFLNIAYRLLGGNAILPTPQVNYTKYLQPRISKQEDVQVPQEYAQKYRLLQYIIDHWVFFTAPYRLIVSTPQFQDLVRCKRLPFDFRPWGSNTHFGPYGCVSCSNKVEAQNPEFQFVSLFHYAAEFGHWGLMVPFVNEYCAHERPNNETLMIACRHGQALIVQMLLEKVDFDLSDGRAVEIAAASGYSDVLSTILTRNFDQTLLARESTISNSRSKKERSLAHIYPVNAQGFKPLIMAASNGHEEAVEVLCRYDMDIDGKDGRTGATALQAAVANGHDEIVRILLKRGATNFDAQDTRFASDLILHQAAENGHIMIYKTILDHAIKASKLPTYSSAHLVNRKAQDGRTALHKAIVNGHEAMAEALVKWDANGLATTPSSDSEDGGCNALHLAATYGGHINLLELLIRQGIPIDIQIKETGQTALIKAAAKGHQPEIRWTIENGASTDSFCLNHASGQSCFAIPDRANTSVSSEAAVLIQGLRMEYEQNPFIFALRSVSDAFLRQVFRDKHAWKWWKFDDQKKKALAYAHSINSPLSELLSQAFEQEDREI